MIFSFDNVVKDIETLNYITPSISWKKNDLKYGVELFDLNLWDLYAKGLRKSGTQRHIFFPS